MKSFIVFALFVAAAVAAPPLSPEALAETVVYENNNIGVEGYDYAVKTSNGIEQRESAALENVGTENEGISVRGQFSYTGNDGVIYSVTYRANALEGFVAEGAHIPQA